MSPSESTSLSDDAAAGKRPAMSEPQRPEARSPRGFIDRRARDVVSERAILSAVSGVYERWGFEPLETGAFEYADALGKFLPDADRPNEGVFALQDDDEQWMALRYDLTAPLARFAAQTLSPIKVPAHWEIYPEALPRNAAGKVLKNVLTGETEKMQVDE